MVLLFRFLSNNINKRDRSGHRLTDSFSEEESVEAVLGSEKKQRKLRETSWREAQEAQFEPEDLGQRREASFTPKRISSKVLDDLLKTACWMNSPEGNKWRRKGRRK